MVSWLVKAGRDGIHLQAEHPGRFEAVATFCQTLADQSNNCGDIKQPRSPPTDTYVHGQTHDPLQSDRAGGCANTTWLSKTIQIDQDPIFGQTLKSNGFISVLYVSVRNDIMK